MTRETFQEAKSRVATALEAHGNVATYRVETGEFRSFCTCGHRYEGVWDPYGSLDEEKEDHLAEALAKDLLNVQP